jgi:hypothetical protein
VVGAGERAPALSVGGRGMARASAANERRNAGRTGDAAGSAGPPTESAGWADRTSACLGWQAAHQHEHPLIAGRPATRTAGGFGSVRTLPGGVSLDLVIH